MPGYKQALNKDNSTLMPLISFADFDRDGMTDMIYDSGSQIYIFYNKLVANAATEANLCKGSQDSGYLASNRIFVKFDNAINDLTSFYHQEIKLDAYTQTVGLTPAAMNIPGRLSIGDIDADGFPDILACILTPNITDKNTPLSFSKVLLNIPCQS